MGGKPLLSLNTRTSDSCNNVTLKKEEENHQWGNGHSHAHKQFGDINRLGGDKGREHYLHCPRGGVLTDHQRPEERIPTADKRNDSHGDQNRNRVGQQQAPVDTEIAQAIDTASILQIAGEVQVELAEKETSKAAEKLRNNDALERADPAQPADN